MRWPDMTDTIKALKLADELEAIVTNFRMPGRLNIETAAADMLRTQAAEVDRQAAEIDRLRAALEQIARMPHAPDAWIVAGIALESPEAASAALTEQPKSRSDDGDKALSMWGRSVRYKDMQAEAQRAATTAAVAAERKIRMATKTRDQR